MKKIICFFTCVVFTLSMVSCFGGDVKNVEIIKRPSDIYSQEDIDSAIDVIVDEFDKDWDGCKLNKIGYAGDDAIDENKDYLKGKLDGKDADEVIVLTSDFYVDSTGGDGSLNQDFTYKHWKWILVREKGGEWTHVDHTAM